MDRRPRTTRTFVDGSAGVLIAACGFGLCQRHECKRDRLRGSSDVARRRRRNSFDAARGWIRELEVEEKLRNPAPPPITATKHIAFQKRVLPPAD